MKYLVLLETAGNQNFIFATNRLRENVGASELTYRSGTKWVLEAVANHGGPKLFDPEPKKLRANLKNSAARGGIEVIVATSGKAILVCEERALAEQIVAEATLRALQEAPGLDLAGAICEFGPTTPVHAAIRAVHDRLAQIRFARPQPLARFANWPMSAPCASSGLPASGIERVQGEPQLLSAPALAKRESSEDWQSRLRKITAKLPNADQVARSLDELEKRQGDSKWIGLVHADGNGIGQIFLKLDKISGYQTSAQNPDYLKTLREFSLELEAATEAAFLAACQSLPPKALIVPLVLGGDDFTALVSGEAALGFVNNFLLAFEKATSDSLILSQIVQKDRPGAQGFSSCAGLALFKSHFPFHQAYELAESLIESAKTVKQRFEKRPIPSAFDFHLLFDGSYTNLRAIRERITIDKTFLWGAPYLVSGDFSDPWVAWHSAEKLREAIGVLNRQTEEGRPNLPSSQTHDLRAALFRGQDHAEHRFKELILRYPGFAQLANDRENLFFSEEGTFRTNFLDALTAQTFWEQK